MRVLTSLSEEERTELRLLSENILFDYTDEDDVPRDKIKRLAELAARSFLPAGETR